jgi:hypothetical protein
MAEARPMPENRGFGDFARFDEAAHRMRSSDHVCQIHCPEALTENRRKIIDRPIGRVRQPTLCKTRSAAVAE